MMLRSTIATLALCLMSAACNAQASGTALPQHPFVSTSGKAQLWMRPDIGEVKFEAGAQDASSETAAAQLQQLSAGAMQLLAEHGVQEADIESYEVEKKTVPLGDGQAPAYSMGRLFHARVRDLAQWPDLIARLVEMAHITSISSTFDRTDGDDINTQLMAAAADDARNKGNSLAKLSAANSARWSPLHAARWPRSERRSWNSRLAGKRAAQPRKPANTACRIPSPIHRP